MKKLLLAFTALVFGLNAQSPRVMLYEEFTGETCPPCASTNPGLNTLLLSATNATRVIPIKWQVPIPSAPSNTWSIYQTDKIEIDWRWKSTANGGYGYIPAVTYAPFGKIDGQSQGVFGATGSSIDHPVNLNNTIISNAVNVPSSFNILMTRDVITNNSTSANVNVTVQATAPYNTSSSLVFRTVLIERVINFSVQPGTNGEKDFYDPVRKSYPTLQSGTSLPSTWTVGQVYTFSMNCVFPNYIHSNLQIEFVGFIQNEGTQKVEQTMRTGWVSPLFDAAASSVNPPMVCSTANTFAPMVPVKNNGQSPITGVTIVPYIDGVAQGSTQWTGNIMPGYSGFVQLNPLTSATISGMHTFSYNITSVNGGTETDLTNNGASGSYYGVYNYQSNPIVEGFSASGFPYQGWYLINPNSGSATWKYQTGIEGYNIGSGNCLKYDFFNNNVLGDKDELLLPPVDLTGVGTPAISFDIAYAVKSSSAADKLEVKASKDCGATWTTVWSAIGVNLAANQIINPNVYLSPQPQDWTTFGANLPGFNQANVLVKLVATNQNGNNLYLDNINLASSSIPDGITKNNSSANGIKFFPNPTNGITNLEINSIKNQNAKLTVTNSLGQKVLELPLNLNKGNNNFALDLASYDSGIYFVNLDGDNLKTFTKVSVTK